MRGFAIAVIVPCLAFIAKADDVAARLLTWRCSVDNAAVQVLDECAGRKDVLEVKYPQSASRSGGRVDFASYAIREMMDAWIPPYVGIRARRIRLDVCPVDCPKTANPVLRYRFMPKWNKAEWRTVEHSGWLQGLRIGEWGELSFPVEHSALERLSDVSIVFDNSGPCTFAVSGLSLVLDDGSRYELANRQAPSYLVGMDKPLSRGPTKPFPSRPRIQFGVGAHWCAMYGEDSAAVGAFMKRFLPEYDIVLSLDGALDPVTAKKMALAPDNLFWQVQGGRYGLDYARIMDALIKDADGQMQSMRFNSAVGTHPLLRRCYEDQLSYYGSLGVNNVQRFDYVWYHPRAAAGFDDASVAAFREDLAESDEGLLLCAYGGRPERRIHFWDYYADYYGRRAVPGEYGLDDWRNYVPNVSSDRGKKMHWALVAYEWLRLAQRFGEWSERHCHGAKYDFLLNGEGCNNGNDHVYLARLKRTGICSPEFFSWTMKSLMGVYHGSGRYLRNAKACGKRFGITVETSRGAGGSQPYWSAKTGYAVCYMLSALGYDSFEFDGILHTFGWKDYVGSRFGRMELCLAMADARGYRQAKLDGARPRKGNGVYLLTERAVAGASQKRFLDNTPDDFRREMIPGELVYETTDPQELPDVLGDARVIFCSLSTPRTDVSDLLAKWRRDRADRVLVTERGTALAVADRLGLERLQKPKDGESAADVAVFDCNAGSAAVLFNREACRTADRERWYETVWRPVDNKCTYDPSKLLYFDKCEGAAVSAEVKVASDGAYRIYRAVDGREVVENSSGGWLRLDLDDSFADVFYYGPDTKAYRAFLAQVKAERNVSARFFNADVQEGGSR